MAGNLSTLITSGFDAFNNLWDVDIMLPAKATSKSTNNNNNAKTGSSNSDIGSDISLRTADFTPPKFSLKTYKVAYKGIELERLSATLEYKDNRELTLKFRMDGQYDLLSKLQAWKQLYYNPSNDGNIRFGAYSSATSDDYYGVITVKAYASVKTDGTGLTLNDLISEGNPDHLKYAQIWKFKQVVLLDVNVGQYTREGDSKAQEVECMFVYGEVEEPSMGASSSLT